MKRPKLKLNLHDKDGVLIKHLLPFVNLVCSKSDRDIGIQLLGFHTKQSYMNAFTQDRRYGDMLAIIIGFYLTN